MKPRVIHPYRGMSKLGLPGRQPRSPIRPVIYLPTKRGIYIHTTPTGHRDARSAAPLHQVGSRPLVAVCSLAPVSSLNFGVSTSKQCPGHLLAISRGPCIRSTLYHCGQVCGGIQQMQTYTSAFKTRRVLLNPTPPLPSRLHSTHTLTATKDSQSRGTLVPRSMVLWEWFCWC